MYATAAEYLGLYKIPKSNLRNIEQFSLPIREGTVKEGYEEKSPPSTVDPKVWGPSFWYTLHVSAAHYPVHASPFVKERMKQRILAIPYEIPCQNCRVHANAFVEKNKDRLDTIVSGRHELGKFYVDFHNKVNKRYGKPEWTYEQAYKMYAGSTQVNFL